MAVRYSDKLPHAFVVSPDDLEKLVELLQDYIGKVNMSADCIDGIKREFGEVQDLIAYENPKSKRIRSIHLSARSDDSSRYATIDFGHSVFQDQEVSINIDGPEDVVSRLKEKVLDILSGMRPWYNWIVRADLVSMFTTGFFILLFILYISVLFEWIPVSDSPSSDSSRAKSSAIVGLFTLTVLFGLWGLYRLRSVLFPKMVFTIGQGESRFKLLEKIRWIVIAVIGGSLAAGVIRMILQVIAA